VGKSDLLKLVNFDVSAVTGQRLCVGVPLVIDGTFNMRRRRHYACIYFEMTIPQA
jgi:hypothetical protein